MPDGTVRLERVKCRPGNLKDIHNVVGPILETSHIEHVNVFWMFNMEPMRYLDAFVNEDGLELRLPMNRSATMIYQNNVRVHDPAKFDPAKMPYIVGPMILFEEKVWL